MIKKAVIPAAGLGTSFLPATKVQPKEMLPIIDIPTIQYVVQECVDSGIEDILIIGCQHHSAKVSVLLELPGNDGGPEQTPRF